MTDKPTGLSHSDPQLRQCGGGGASQCTTTLVQPNGATDWKPLSSFPEFGVPLAVGVSAAPVAMPPQTHVSGNNYAIAGMVLGVMSILCCGAGWLFGILGSGFFPVWL